MRSYWNLPKKRQSSGNWQLLQAYQKFPFSAFTGPDSYYRLQHRPSEDNILGKPNPLRTRTLAFAFVVTSYSHPRPDHQNICHFNTLCPLHMLWSVLCVSCPYQAPSFAQPNNMGGGGEEYQQWWNSSLCNILRRLVFPFSLDPNILLRAITIIFALTSEPPVIADWHNKSRHLIIICVV